MREKVKFKIICIVLFIFTEICISQWSTDPTENNIVSWNVEIPIITTDMQNGIIVVAQTHPAYSIIFAQRMTVDGERLWPGDEGIHISSNSNSQWFWWEGITPEREFVMSDGAGGCYVGYLIAKKVGWTHETPFYDVNAYIQRLDQNGNLLFGSDGLMLMQDGPDSSGYYQIFSTWCPDGHGGIYVSWHRWTGLDGSYENVGTYLVRISENGEFVWGPKKMSPSTVDYIPYLDSELNLNLYYYLGETTPKTPDRFIKINPQNGEVIIDREIEIGVGEYGFNGFYDYCNSEDFSAVFVFRDFRADTLRIQKLDSDGNTKWGDKPIIIDTDLFRKTTFDVESDHQGGAYIFYKTIDDTFHLVHFNNQGIRTWDWSFYSTMLYLDVQNMMSVGADGSVFILKEKIKYLTKLNSSGDLLWETLVSSRNTIATSINFPKLLADNLGGCIVLWQEGSSQFYGLRAQRVDRNGNLGNPVSVSTAYKKELPNQINIKSVNPNPFNNSVKIEFVLQHLQNISLKVYNILGKEVNILKSGELRGGEHSITWYGTDNSGQSLSSGIYFLVLKTNANFVSHKILLIR